MLPKITLLPSSPELDLFEKTNKENGNATVILTCRCKFLAEMSFFSPNTVKPPRLFEWDSSICTDRNAPRIVSQTQIYLRHRDGKREKRRKNTQKKGFASEQSQRQEMCTVWENRRGGEKLCVCGGDGRGTGVME